MNKEQRNETTVERRYLRAFSKMRIPGAYLYKRIFVDINIHIIFIESFFIRERRKGR